MANNIKKVIISGAGPTGLLLALLLSQHGIFVDVLESGEGVDQRPRGLAYGAAATRVLRRAGTIEELRQKTWNVQSMAWRRLNGDKIAAMDLSEDQSPDRFLLYPVHMLSNLLLEHLSKQPTASVYMNHQVIGVGDNGQKAWVDIKSGQITKRIEGDFVIGCDGANSGVRKALFGGEFPGHTWPQQIVVTNIQYDVHKFGWSDAQWIVDPENWGMVCGILKTEGLWRVAYGEPVGFSDDELRARLPKKLELLLPGSPKPGDYEVVRFSPFIMHQRCVERMRVGRIILVGDAAHLCNPMGGLGLTGGIADVGSLVDCLYGIHDGKADLDILDKYDQIRREIYHNIIDPISSTNLKRLWQDPDIVSKDDPFFTMIAQAALDPSVAKELQLLTIGHDMTQYYKTAEVSDRQPAVSKVLEGGIAVSG